MSARPPALAARPSIWLAVLSGFLRQMFALRERRGTARDDARPRRYGHRMGAWELSASLRAQEVLKQGGSHAAWAKQEVRDNAA